MDSAKRKIYIEASSLYQSGDTEEARKLWETLSPQKPIISSDPLVWRLINKINISKWGVLSVFAIFMMMFISLSLGRGLSVIYYAFGDLFYFKSNIELYKFLELHSIVEINNISFINNIEANSIYEKIDQIILILNQYTISKIFFIQNILLLKIENLFAHSHFLRLGTFYYLFTFVISIMLFITSVIVDIFFMYIFFGWVSRWLVLIFSKLENIIRFFCVLCFCLLVALFIYILNTIYLKNKEANYERPPMTMKNLFPVDNGGNRNPINKSNKQEMTEKEYVKMNKEKMFDNKPLSLEERAKLMEIIKDLYKLERKYGIRTQKDTSGANSRNDIFKYVDMLKKGKVKEVIEQLKMKKSMKEILERIKKSGLTAEDKTFKDVLEKSFRSSDPSVRKEYLKMKKELEELYGQSISRKVYSAQNQNELLKEFSKNKNLAKEKMRNKFRQTLQKQLNIGRTNVEVNDKKIRMEMHSIINYLEGGGDIKYFNLMRVKFLEKYTDKRVRLNFTNKILFLMTSWNEHQVKYFWQMNSELMLEIILMTEEAFKSLNIDIRGAGLGWLYLVAGYYEKARKVCLASAEFNEARSRLGRRDGKIQFAFTNRANAALAALMLGMGEVAYIEYQYIYEQSAVKKGSNRKLEDLYLSEFVREITATLASSKPCFEAYACRSMFLEGISDELALKDLKLYLALNTKNNLINKQVQLKVKMLVDRMSRKK
ncbi:MAG: hypothetical protein COA79_00675 [Planctomycetota bacterium]|nr:MAG: hypothetical protein COA79_00675 [Planctomycetota bacterium]